MCKKSQKKNGFTLVEILVALTIFSLAISVAVGTFVSGSGLQRKTMELYSVQREGGYLIETISRELRMAIDISDGSDDNEDQRGNNDSSIEFTNYNGDLIKYCRSSAAGNCTNNDSGDYLSRDGKIINSDDIKIEYLKFYVSESFTSTQPLVTIVMKVKSTGRYGTELTLQNSIAMRLY
jgi:prepilin-type N-terminal cleavage/methylation domain-containing protein